MRRWWCASKKHNRPKEGLAIAVRSLVAGECSRGRWAGVPTRLYLHSAGLAGGLLFAKLGAAPQLTGLFVMLMGTELFLYAAALDEFLETSQRHSDRFFVVHAHP